MKTLYKRVISLLLVLSISFLCCPLNAEAEEVPAETVSAPAYVSSCSDSEKLYCEFDLDLNAMHHFADSVIAFNFDIYRICGTEEYTAEISSTIDITHNISDSTVYTVENNHVTLCITVTEEYPVQNLDDLSFENITIDLVNQDGVSVYSFVMSVMNTQYGVFVDFLSLEHLEREYIKWLRNNNYISTNAFNQHVETMLTASDYNERNSGFNLVSSDSTFYSYFTPSSVYVSYTITALNSGENIQIRGYIYWVDTNAIRHGLHQLEIDICDKEVASYTTLTTTTTDETGYFDVTIENETGILENGGCDIRLKIKAKNKYCRIRYALETTSSQDNTYFFYVNCGDNVNSNVSRAVSYGVNDTSKSFNILDAIYFGGNHVKAISGDTIPSVVINYPISDNIGSFYLASNVNIAASHYASWDVILHEYGHYVSDKYGIYPLVAMAHSARQNQISYIINNRLVTTGGADYDGCCLAWQEGWATYFAISSQIEQNVRSLIVPLAGDVRYDDGTYSDNIESNITSGTFTHGIGEANELAVARVLWDLSDVYGSTNGAANESAVDRIGLGFSRVWRYSVNSEAEMFSDFISYLYTQFSITSTTYKYIGLILGDQRITAHSLAATINDGSIVLSWSNAYTDTSTGVQNRYYIRIFDRSMNQLYRIYVTPSSSPYTLPLYIINDLYENYSSGFNWCVEVTPDTDCSTGPYYSVISNQTLD